LRYIRELRRILCADMVESITAQRSEDGTDGSTGALPFYLIEKSRPSRPEGVE
jgi:hypothetical protein